MYVVYHVDVGRCMTDEQERRTDARSKLGTLFLAQPENLAVAECIMGTGQHEIQQHLQNGQGRRVCGLLG